MDKTKAGLTATFATGAAMLVTAVAVAGCSQPSDYSEIVTFTDEHGRVCTGAVVVDEDDGDREISTIDCEYPPQGTEPGPTRYTRMPED